MDKLFFFFLSFLLFFLPVPMLGVYAQSSFLSLNIFNYSYSMYELGISSDIGKTIIGEGKWLFLGDNYNHVLSKSYADYHLPKEDVEKNEVFMEKLESLAKKHNSDFLFLSTPNKHSIYGDKIGIDTMVNSYSFYDKHALMKRSDLTRYLREVKSKGAAGELYFKTDTHWNDYGAFHGYQYLMNDQLNAKYKSIPLSTPFNRVEHSGGDLARFLNIMDFVNDNNMSLVTPDSTLVERVNLSTGESSVEDIQGSISNAEIKVAIQVKNDKALNNITVLWLHDSFGNAMSPYMHSTFSTVVHQHYNDAFKDMEDFQNLVNRVNPDLILLSSVERSALSFGRYLP
jgi:hypothetical protein